MKCPLCGNELDIKKCNDGEIDYSCKNCYLMVVNDIDKIKTLEDYFDYCTEYYEPEEGVTYFTNCGQEV